MYGNKKDVGETSAAYPSHQAFALPFHRDKQLSQPTPIAYYIMTYAQYPHGHTFAYRYNTPWHGRFVARSSDGFKVAKFDDSKITFRKRPFPAPPWNTLQTLIYNMRHLRSTKSIMSWPTHPFGLAESTAKLQHFFESCKLYVYFAAFFYSLDHLMCPKNGGQYSLSHSKVG